MIYSSPRQLEVFAAIASANSVRAAAQQLHMTQPAASMALAELERHLDTLLFARENGRLRLNEQGRELLPLVHEILDRLQEVQHRAAGQPRELTGELRIGASNSVGNYYVGGLLGDFVRNHKRVAVRLRVGNTHAIAADIHDYKLDVGCVEGAVTGTDLDVRLWRRDHLVVCAAPAHPLARLRPLRKRDLAGARWILREQGSATRTQSERALLSLPLGETVLELGQIEAIKQAVIANMGIAFLPQVAVVDAVQSGRIRILRTPFLQLERQLSLVLRRDKYHGALVRTLLETLGIDSTRPKAPVANKQ